MFHQMWGDLFDSAETVVLVAKAPGVWPVGFTDAGSVPRQPLNTFMLCLL